MELWSREQIIYLINQILDVENHTEEEINRLVEKLVIISRSGKHRDALRKATAHGEESSKTGKESGNSPKESTSFIME